LSTKQEIDTKNNIYIQGARLHNLKNIDVRIPRNKLVVITGLSGSGKSSLAIDTLYAEGQRRYVESLSSYARQFLGRLNKPEVDAILGISPAIAIEQKVNSTNPRSTVGTSTEIYDYMRLLFSRIGTTYSPISGNPVKKDTVTDVIDYIKSTSDGERMLLLAPVIPESGRSMKEKLEALTQQGYARIQVDGEAYRMHQVEDIELDGKTINLVVDRIVKQEDEDFYNRLGDSVELAFYEGKGTIYIESVEDATHHEFSNRFEADGMEFIEPSVHLFNFNNPYGACPTCEGYGDTMGIDEHLVIPNSALSVYDNAVFPWRGETMSWFRDQLVNNAYKFDFPIHKPWFELTDKQKQLVWDGNEHFEGLHKFFENLEAKAYKIQNRVMLSRYRGKTRCSTCGGQRLRKEASYVKINGKSVQELVVLPLNELDVFFNDLSLTEYEETVASRLLIEIRSRISFLLNVGLSYLTLNRKSNTLSGGESQRINLATSLGSSLVGSMYILDEPSIGLHPKDTQRLIKVLKALRDLGNTVIVVEHDKDIMKASDYIIDIGPEAGSFGGEVVAEGNYDEILKADSLTAKYLNKEMEIAVPKERRKSKDYIEIVGAREHNLKNIDVKIPLHSFVAITGVSGSGKSTLVRNILFPALQRSLGGSGEKPGQFTELRGAIDKIESVEFINQNPIGRSSRSNPITYIKAFDDIRHLFADQKLSTLRQYKAKHFSFNVDGGRCETCKGDGEVTIEMQFMADVQLKCEDCNGMRYKKELLEVKFQDKNIHDVLQMTVDDAVSFFNLHEVNKIADKLQPLQDVGLGYVQLGQSSSTLSGGEAQRIKLASFLLKGKSSKTTLFIFDEPTTGLHFHDIQKLLNSFNALLENGHSLLVIEHDLDLIKCADHIIDLGLEGGYKGGNIVASGTPEDVAKNKTSYTGIHLKEEL